MKRIKVKTESHSFSGTSAMALTFPAARDMKLLAVLIHFGASVSETVTVKHDSAEGTNYDTTLDTTTLSSATDYTYIPSGGVPFAEGEGVLVNCTDATASTTAYVTVKYIEEFSS